MPHALLKKTHRIICAAKTTFPGGELSSALPELAHLPQRLEEQGPGVRRKLIHAPCLAVLSIGPPTVAE